MASPIQVLLVSFLLWDVSGETCLRRCRGEKEYAVIIDGGSSSSKIRVFEWTSLSAGDPTALPTIREVVSSKREPGVSSFDGDLRGLENHFTELISSVRHGVPADDRSRTELFFMATAGMRLLLENRANDMIENIDRLLSNMSINPFNFDPDNSRILSGEEEGVFAWIAVNYLKNVFKEQMVEASETFGVMEMGGASTQITFVSNKNILANKFPATISGVTYNLYTHSYLYYGQNYVEIWTKDDLYNKSADHSRDIVNPCMLKGDVKVRTIDGRNISFVGAGSYSECEKLLNEFVYKSGNWKCQPKPCAIGSVYQPTIHPNMEFIATGSFYRTLDTLGLLINSSKFSYSKTLESAERFCSLFKSDALTSHPKITNERFVSVFCLLGTYIPMLFSQGYRFPAHTTQISVVDKLNGKSPGWPLGALIYEYEKREACDCLIASSSYQVRAMSGCLTLVVWVICTVM